MIYNNTQNSEIVVILTGASGSIYGIRLVEKLLESGTRVSVLLSDAGRQVLKYETGIDWHGESRDIEQQMRGHFKSEQMKYFDTNDLFAPIASGSSAPEAVVIAPCSMGTVGRIAAGLSENLIERVADVALKEQKQLVLVPRETPFSQVHLENLLRLSRSGAQILPAMPAFYQQPESVEDLVDFVVGKILDSLGIEHSLFVRWGESPGSV